MIPQFLAYLYNLPNSTADIDTILSQTTNVFPAFTPLILFFVFFVVLLGGITRQKLRNGTADYSAWAIIASMATLLPALLFSVNAGFIRLDWRSEEHTSELQSHSFISYAVFCWKKKN